MKKHLWAICYGLALTTFTAYAALDTFVISRSYSERTTEMNLSMFDNAEPVPVTTDSGSVTLPDSSVSDVQGEESVSESRSKPSRTHSGGSRPSHKNSQTENSDGTEDTQQSAANITGGVDGGTKQLTDENGNYSITLTEYYENSTKIYVADVRVSSAQYLKTAFADDTYGKNITDYTSTIAGAHNAAFAVNGDFYGVRENGYVIRNGVVYRSEASGNELMCIFADGSMRVMNDSDYSAEELVGMGVWQALDFGPGLIENGSVTVGTNDEVDRAMADNPRTAIGVIDSNHFVFVVSDGRTSESKGLTLYQLADFMQRLGITTAYNLDGGGSSTMYFDGAVINNPTSGRRIKERAVSDIVYIG